MDFKQYKRQATMAHTNSTIQDRKSFLRLFDVWLAGERSDSLDGSQTVERFKKLKQSKRRQYGFSDNEPETFEEVKEFILFLYTELDYSRTMCRHYFDAIQSYCKRLRLEFYDSEEFKQFRDDNLNSPNNPNFDANTVFTLDEVKQLIQTLNKPHQDFVLIQYLHCRRPGEVKDLKASDFNFDRRTVTYNIKKQKYGEDNRRQADIVNDDELQYLEQLVDAESGYLFPRAHLDLEHVRKPFREVGDELGITQLPLKNLRHTRISQLKTVGWPSEDIRDTYTHHKHLSTLQNRYLSSVDEGLKHKDLWAVIP